MPKIGLSRATDRKVIMHGLTWKDTLLFVGQWGLIIALTAGGLSLVVRSIGKAIYTAKGRPADEALIAQLSEEVRRTQAVALDSMRTVRLALPGADPAEAAERSTDDESALSVGEDSLIERLATVLGVIDGHPSEAEVGFVLQYATPQRLALVFAANLGLAATIHRFAKARSLSERALRRTLRQRLEAAAAISNTDAMTDPDAALAELTDEVDNTPTSVGELVGAGASKD
jgi:hypothetical protein